MSAYEAVADLPLTIDDYELTQRERPTSSGFDRVTTTFHLQNGGCVGRGEDVCYDTPDHEALVANHDFDFAGEYTFDEFSSLLDDVDLFPGAEPERGTSEHYRRWAVESAALDLALRQADTSLAGVLDRTYDPVRFVVSTRLPDPPSADRIREWLDVDPDMEFKLDPTPDWDADLITTLNGTEAVRVVDLKGLYEDTSVDVEASPEFYRRVVEGFPDAVVEDAKVDDETRPVLEPHRDRLSWDYPITGIESIEDLPFEPSWMNVKPSRFGTVESVLDTIEYCEDHEIRLYGGGQFELDVGREHIHALASLFYPDAPNDVAPSGYNDPEVREDLPGSPLSPPDEPAGLAW